MGKGAALEDIPPAAPPGNRTAGAASQGQAADIRRCYAPLTDSSRLFWTICGDGGYTTRAMFGGKLFGTIGPEVEKGKAPPLVLLGGADAYDLVVVELLIAYNPNTISVVLISWNPIIPLRPY